MAVAAATRGASAASRPGPHHNHHNQPSTRGPAARCTTVLQGRAARAGAVAAAAVLLLGCAALLAPATTRRVLLGAGLATALIRVPPAGAKSVSAIVQRRGEVEHTDEEWKELLPPFSYQVLRHEATERPFSSPLNNEKRAGTFLCAGCGSRLFTSATKYNSGTGWPSFYQALPGSVDEVPDLSIPFLPRTEVRCHRCQGHLGHVFDDGPRPTGLRYCMNGAAMQFQAEAA